MINKYKYSRLALLLWSAAVFALGYSLSATKQHGIDGARNKVDHTQPQPASRIWSV